MNGYISVRYFKYSDTRPWTMDCRVCDWNCPASFRSWGEAMEAALACVAKHEANRCGHCGRTS